MLRLIFIFFTAAVIFIGCGIPNIPYIEPPEVSSPNSDLQHYNITFNNADENNPVYFFGYSMYYKFYSSNDELEAGVEDLKTADDLNNLLNKDYTFLYRIKNNTGDTGNAGKPITIPIDETDRNDSFSMTLDFNDDIVFIESDVVEDDESGLFGTTITYPGNTIYLGRYVEQNRLDSDNTEDPINKSFKNTAFSEDDSDLPDPSDFEFGTDQYLYMAVYVLSYGKDESWIPVYSNPVYLGKFEIPVSTF